jgi:hypothetical protein
MTDTPVTKLDSNERGLGIFYFPGELDAIKVAKQIGAFYGYGNIIDHLKDAWSERLQQDGMSKDAADAGALHICPWCNVDWRTGKKVKRGKKR